MRRAFKLLLLSAALPAVFGCASAPEVKYVTEAERVTTQALEPVMLESAELENDIRTRFPAYLGADAADTLMRDIQTEIANTGRFARVLLNASEGDAYIVQPRIDRIESFTRDIPADPTRKRFTVKARARLDVLFINQKNQKELVKSFHDERTLEERISSKTNLSPGEKSDFSRRAVTIAFRAAADQLGNGFNPSYEMGVISRVNDRRVYVQMNTSMLRKMPKKQQVVEVVDDDNRVLASLAELIVEDGTVSGRYYEKGGAAVREGMKVRARINALAQ